MPKKKSYTITVEETDGKLDYQPLNDAIEYVLMGGDIEELGAGWCITPSPLGFREKVKDLFVGLIFTIIGVTSLYGWCILLGVIK